MTREKILALTLAEFGLMQEPSIEEDILRKIATFACGESDMPEEPVQWSALVEFERDARKAGSKLTSDSKLKHEEAFCKRLDETSHLLSKITVGKVIEDWLATAKKYFENVDRHWRFTPNIHSMTPFLIGLHYLEFPEHEVEILYESVHAVASGRLIVVPTPSTTQTP